jgi:phage terminase large subunit GpA-like protein
MSVATLAAPIIPIHPRTVACLVPPENLRTWDWIKQYGVTKRGEAFNHLDYPWVEGLADAWDDPDVERIFFRAGSRLGKTETAMQFLLSSQAQDPDIGMIGGPTEPKIKQWIQDRLYPIFEKCVETRHWVPPGHRRGRGHTLKLQHCTTYGAWSGSPTTLGDLDPRYLLAFEISKFTKNASEEADPFELLLERGAEIPDRRFFAESTPTIKGKCRIDRYVSSSTDSRWWCPCPNCDAYQPLILGDREAKKSGGLIWDKDSDGKSQPGIAYKTARYICRHCHKEISEEERLPMIRRGLMVAKGQRATKKGRVIGTPYYSGPDFSFSLSRLYGPTFTFGRYARSFVEAHQDPNDERIRAWLNNWAGEVWTPVQQQKEWEELAEDVCVPEFKAGVIPEGCMFLTVGVDVQVDHWVYVVIAWNHQQQGHVVEWGVQDSWSRLKDNVLRRAYEHADGGPPMFPIMTLIDARDGNRTDEVEDFCKSVNKDSGPWVFSSMGAKPGAMGGKPFRATPVEDKGVAARKRTSRRRLGFCRVIVNTNYYQVWIQNCIDRRKPSDPNSLSFPIEAKSDQDLFAQILNEAPDWQIGKLGDETCMFVRVSMVIPVDFRDSLRYARCGADVYTNLNWNRISKGRALTNAKTIPAAAKQAKPEPEPDKKSFIRKTKSGIFGKR